MIHAALFEQMELAIIASQRKPTPYKSYRTEFIPVTIPVPSVERSFKIEELLRK